MNFSCILCLLLVVASLITTTEATVPNEKITITTSRSLRVVNTLGADPVNVEERATMNLNGVFKDKAVTNALLSTWRKDGKTLQQVSAELKMLGVPLTVAKFSHNWAALVKFQRMRYTKMTGKTLPYAKFGGSRRTASESKEAILKWVMRGDTVDDPAKSLGVPKLSRGELILDQNYKAYKQFVKDQRQWKEIQAGF